ncbi:unnamed protein product [Caenorhabditis angaria]|uniref:long-chain-fatty-acid--CoA ligase n=1 Tax=Caenorhabditis angaria TaxID=860376 RepID=A0A9P1IX84_9PELO|nr:unnamed protein product [Caenorhabditis angaria]
MSNTSSYQHSRLIGGPERIRESVQVTQPITGTPDGFTKTIPDVLRRSYQLNPKALLFGENVNGKYIWTTYGDAIEESKAIGSGIENILLSHPSFPNSTKLIGIAGIHSVRYMYSMHAMAYYNYTVVPLYHMSKFETLCDIIDNCGLELIFVDTKKRTQQFLDIKNETRLATLKTIVLLEIVETLPTHPDVRILSYEDVKNLGNQNFIEGTRPTSESIYVIVHTSGTTGKPKGVEMSHGSLLTSMSGICTSWTIAHNWKFDQNDTYFSFLSLAHIYEHLMQTLVLYFGGKIGIYNGDVKTLIQQIQILRPTIISLVPRLLNKIYENVHNSIGSKNVLTRKLFEFAKKMKTKKLEEEVLENDTIWDKIVFKKCKELLGGNIRLLSTGGAPVTKEVKIFTRIAYGCPLIEGYGQTECGAAGTLTLPYDTTYGNVGGPSPWAQMKVVDVPEKNYFAKNDEGEVCFRGAALMSGYYQDPELTAKTIDEDGWLHTGDIGRWLENGSLQIIDRKNEMFKLCQGEFVSPIQVESIYCNSPLITQIYVTGSTLRSFLVGIVVLESMWFKQLLSNMPEKNYENIPIEKSLGDRKVRNAVMKELNEFGKASGLQTIELLQNVYLTMNEFSEEDGLITSTLKNRRKMLENFWKNEIEQMYNEIESL